VLPTCAAFGAQILVLPPGEESSDSGELPPLKDDQLGAA